MLNQFSRTELLLGKEGIQKLSNSRVAVFGIGGVGGYAAEALIRSGLGSIDIVDDDKVCLTNLNRQLYATRKTVGKFKVEVAKERILEINPDVKVYTHKTFYTPETSEQFDFSQYDYVVDAIDTVVGKLSLIEKCKSAGTPIICAMGAGNKLDPTKFEVADISKTSVCPLARVIRTELRKRKISGVKVVYSKETPIKPINDMAISCRSHCICPPGTVRKCTAKHQIPGSISFVPPVVGFIIAGEVIKDLTKNEE
ncbi:tRNA threonylcarbamoyladenosine dehydratase [bacterium]|nr:tRNA threonylcarbamoyladenosine dehydratase [bacterium]